MRTFGLCLIALLALCGLTEAAIYHVNGATGSDANSCSAAENPASPKLTIQGGVNCATLAGDTVLVASGTYVENVSGFSSGASGSPITTRPADGASVTWDCSGTGLAVNLGGNSFVTIGHEVGGVGAGFMFTGCPGNGDAEVIWSLGDETDKSPAVQGVRIIGNTFNGNGRNAGPGTDPSQIIIMDHTGFPLGSPPGAPVNEIAYNVFVANFGYQITMRAATDTHIHHNTMTGMLGSQSQWNGDIHTAHGVMLTDGSGAEFHARRNLVKENTIHDWDTSVVSPVDYAGVRMDSGAADNTIEGNLIYNVMNGTTWNNNQFAYGIKLEARNHNNTIKNNIVHNINFSSIAISGPFAPNSSNDCIVDGNVIYNPGQYGLDLGWSPGVLAQNNIVVGTPGLAHVIVTSSTLGSGSVTLRNNLYWGSGVTNVGNWNGTHYNAANQTFAQWVSSSGESNSLNVDPLFVNAPTDFHLQSGSPAIGTGFGDIDMGAYPAGNGEPPAVTLIGQWLMDEGTGHTVGDSSGNALHGERCEGATCPEQGPAWATDRLQFDGNNDGVRVAADALLNVTNDITLGAKVKRDRTTVPEGLMAKTNGTLYDFVFYFENDLLCFYSDDASPSGVCGSTPVTGTVSERHVAITRLGNAVTFWVDGVSAGTTTMAGSFAANSLPLWIGNDQSVYHQGTMRDVRLYSGALTQTEIQDWMAEDPPPTEPPEFFPLECCQEPGCTQASNWHPVENAPNAIGVSYHVDTVVGMGNPTTSNILPSGQFNEVPGIFKTAPVDRDIDVPLEVGEKAEIEYRIIVTPPASAGDQIGCRPGGMDSYANIKLLTITEPPRGLRVEGVASSGVTH